MATTHEIKAESRTDAGKGASRRLRRSGKVPAIIYGGHKDPVMVQIVQNLATQYANNEWFYSNILDIQVDGKVERAVLRDMQRHPFKPVFLHMDFQRVVETEALHVRVPIHFLNQERSPAGKTSGIVISHSVTEVEVVCLPRDLPEFIELDLAKLSVGDIIHLSDLKLPEGVEIAALKFGKEHDTAVVSTQHVGSGAGSADDAEGEGDEADAE